MKNVSRSPINLLGREVSHLIPAYDDVPGMISMGERDTLIWQLATPYLQTRDNDAHTLYSYGIARQLLRRLPEADEHIVLPAIILHDTGWSTVDEFDAIQAIAPDRDGSYTWAVFQHEKEGARIAREILTELQIPAGEIDQICEIIDGHDTRLTALSLNDMLVKDSDKVWRVSPHGTDVAMPRFGLNREESLRINSFRAYDDLFTDEAKSMSLALMSVECMDLSPQMMELRTNGRLND
jgi:HD superfamily phosphodiesterase